MSQIRDDGNRQDQQQRPYQKPFFHMHLRWSSNL
jgi:hypothetical protein